MEVLETIGGVFSYNLRRFRGDRTQSEVAEAVNLSLRGYQRLEDGVIPRRSLVSRLAAYFGCKEPELFLDPDLIEEVAAHRPISPDQALFVLRQVVESTKNKTSG